MTTVDKDKHTHYLSHTITFCNPNWIDKYEEGDVIIMNYGNGVYKHYKVKIRKVLEEL